MSRVCDICGKHPAAGNQVSHSQRHTRRMWVPNMQRVRAYVAGKKTRINACTRCIKSGRVQKVG